MQSFNELELSAPIMKAIAELGYEKPSPIQVETLPILLGEPTDFIGLAATGTGKTAAFGIPLLERIDAAVKTVQGLILCPTRELAVQVSGQINLLGKHLGVKAIPIYGGSSYGDQIQGLKRGAQIVVGTPGRIVDHLDRGTLRMDTLHTVILDEADEMISMGFKDDLEKILGTVPEGMSNIWLFSATMSREVRKVADEYLNEPAQVQVNKTEMLPESIEQLYYATSESNKPEVLCKLMDAATDFYGLIFCQTKALVTDLTRYLKDRGYRVDCLHGDMDQTARDRTMQAFRDRKVAMLVCTDVASRGLDVKDITHVMNYSIPRELDNYVHRIGRTGRSGKTGFAMSLVTPSHRVLIGRIERMTKSKMREGKIPTRKEIGIKKISQALIQFQEQKSFSRAVELMSPEWKAAIAEMSGEEIVGRFLSVTHPEVFAESRDQGHSEQAYTPRQQPATPGTGVVVKSSETSRSTNGNGSGGYGYGAPRSGGYGGGYGGGGGYKGRRENRFEGRREGREEGGRAISFVTAEARPEARPEEGRTQEGPVVREKKSPWQPYGPKREERAASGFASGFGGGGGGWVGAGPKKAAYGKPSSGKFSAEGKPGFGKPRAETDSKPAYGKPAYGKPAYGKPAYGKPAYGKPAYAKAAGEGRSFGKPGTGGDRPLSRGGK